MELGSKLSEAKRWLKRCLKNKVSINDKTIIAIMIAGVLGVNRIAYSKLEAVYIDFETGAAGVGWNWRESDFWNKRDKKGNVLLAPTKSDSDFVKKNNLNSNIENSVIIGLNSGGLNEKKYMTVVGDSSRGLNNYATAVGYGAISSGERATAIGAESKAQNAQATAVGNKVYAAAQGTAIGADVMAGGNASIAIGSDDIFASGQKKTFNSPDLKAGVGGFSDRLPEDTIKKIYGYKDKTNNGNGSITYSDLLDENSFNKLYIKSDHNEDHRMYSPTYAAGVGAIAIGSRSVAYGNASLAIGTLSFGLADRSTAVGVRAFVDFSAKGGVAIGDESRVFAENSFAIGNNSESTSEGSLSYGSLSKAVGDGSIAIGTSVASNAKLDDEVSNKFRNSIMEKTQLGTVTEKQNSDNSVTATIQNFKIGNDNIIVGAGFPARKVSGNKITTLIDEIVAENTFKFQKESEIVLTTSEDIKKTSKQGNHAVSLGYHISNNGENTIAIGSASYVRGDNSVVIGALNNLGQHATNSIAIGIGTNVHKENSIAFGTGTTIVGAGSVGIGSGVGITQDNSIGIGYGSSVLSSSSMAIGNDSKVNENTSNSVALGNNSNASMQNSVALGYRSTTNYFYKDDTDKSTASLTGKSAIELAGYKPEGSTYEIETDTLSGIVSVGGWDVTKTADGNTSLNSAKGNKYNVGLRRLVHIAPGALDSDAATIGQLKAMLYISREPNVVYYTIDSNNNKVKVIKSDGEFYYVDTSNGEPIKGEKVDKSNVLAGAKGYDEGKFLHKGKQLATMGTKIKFGHIADGSISKISDEAITGSQLYNLGNDILGISLKKDSTTLYENPSFTKVKYNGVTGDDKHTTFKSAIDELITAVNKGMVFKDGGSGTSTLQLGDSLTFNGDDKYITANVGNDKTVKYSASVLSEIKDADATNNQGIQAKVDNDKLVTGKVVKSYVDSKLANVAAKFTVKGDNNKTGSQTDKEEYELNKENTELNINGDNNITTTVSSTDKKITIALKDELTSIKSISNTDTKIELKNEKGADSNTNKSIIFTTGTDKSVTLSENKFSGVAEISSKDNKSKIELANNKIELSPEDNVKLTLEKDGTTTNVKATGISTVGLDDKNALTFKNDNNTHTVELKVDDKTLTFKKDGENIQISNLGSGIGTDTNGDKVNKILSGKGYDTIKSNAVNIDDLSMVARKLKNDVEGATIKYKSDGGGQTTNENDKEINEYTTKISDGLNFVKSENISVKVGDKGEIKHTLNSNLKEINSIQSGTDSKGSKITFTSATPVTDTNQTKAVSSKIEFTLGDSKGSETVFNLTNEGLDLSSKKIKGIANGTDENDAVNKSQLNGVVTALGGGASIQTDGSIKSPTYSLKAGATAGKTTQDYKTVQQALEALDNALNTGLDAKLTFVGNDGKNVEKKLGQTLELVGKGLNKQQANKFTGTSGNIAVKKNGSKLEISLNEKLSSIKKIENGKYSSIEFNADDRQGLSKTIKNLILIGNGTKMVLSHKGVHINGKQLNGLKSGLLENYNGKDADRKGLDYLVADNFNNSSIKDKAVNVDDLAKISKEIVEKGYNYSADIPDKDAKSIKLGSTISVIRWDGVKDTKINSDNYVGDNLVTRYTYNEGSPKIEIGFKERPIFKSVTLDKKQEYNSKINENEKNELITKDYLEQALNNFKINVKTNGKDAVAIGRNGTINFIDGLNIKVEQPSNNKENTESVPTNLKSAESTQENTTTSTTTSDDLNVKISTKKELKEITLLETEKNKDGIKSMLSQDGLVVSTGDKDKKVVELKAENGSGSLTIKDKDDKSIKITGTKISGLADIDPDGTDGSIAVNKNYVDKKMSQAKQGIDKAMSGVANAVAMANLVQTDSNSGYRHQIGAGYGTYENEHAIALGMSGVSENGKVVYKVSGSVNNRGNVAAGIGLGYQFGKKNEFSSDNANKLAELIKENEANKKENEANKKKNIENEAKIEKLEKLVNTLMTNKSETKLYTINQFEFGKSTLTKAQIIKLKAIVKEINEKYSDRTIDITGFSDIVGQESFNLDLGLNRANKVSDLMIEFGLKNPQNIRKVSSYGYNNSVSKTNNQNRRVEIEIK